MLFLIILAGHSHCIPADDVECPNSQVDHLRAWVDKLEGDVSVATSGLVISDRDRNDVIWTAIFAYGAAGDVAKAIELIEQHVPQDRQDGYLTGLAADVSLFQDDRTALTVVAKIREDSQRQHALSLVLVSQAQQGHLEVADQLLSLVHQPTARDWALAQIAEGYAESGDLASAEKHVELIVSDDLRRETRRAMTEQELEKRRTLNSIRSRHLRMMLAGWMISPVTKAQLEALKSVLAAERSDVAAFNSHYQLAMEVSSQAEGEHAVKTRTILALGSVLAQKRSQAIELLTIGANVTDPENDSTLGVINELLNSENIFASPIAAELLVRLDRMMDLRDVLREASDDVDRIHLLASTASTLGELHRLQEADALYSELESPVEKVHFCVGIIRSLPASLAE